MKLLQQYKAACMTRRLAPRTVQIYGRWVEDFLRFHQKRTGHWVHPAEMGEREVEAFLTHLAVNRRLAASSQNQALGALLFLYRHLLRKARVPRLVVGRSLDVCHLLAGVWGWMLVNADYARKQCGGSFDRPRGLKYVTRCRTA